MTPKMSLGKVNFKKNLAGNVWLVRLDLEERAEYLPGQYVSIKVTPDGTRRSYSVASLPGELWIDLLIDVTPMGVGSKYILGLSVGDTVELLGFLGHFVVEADLLVKNMQAFFVATGTGIAPLRPMIEDLLENKKYQGEINLVWGMRHEEDLYWMKELESLQEEYKNFHFYPILSQPNTKWSGLVGHVQDVLEKMEVDGSRSLAYLCGATKMIDETCLLLINKGVPEEEIIFERYS